MNRLHSFRVSALFVFGIFGVVQADDWSADQAEVWAAIETCNSHFRDDRLKEIMDCIHDDFSGWLYSEPVPRGKENFEKVGQYFLRTRDVVAGELRPIDILVYENFAVIHYFYIEITKDGDGNEEINQGRWTDVMVKEGGKWRWIADHGGGRPD